MCCIIGLMLYHIHFVLLWLSETIQVLNLHAHFSFLVIINYLAIDVCNILLILLPESIITGHDMARRND